jgi:hypothetical protein
MIEQDEDEASRMLRGILSPVEAQSLVPSPPTHPPVSGPGESTPVTGSLATPPSQAMPSRSGLAGYFAAGQAPERGGYVKVLSHGQVGYLPAANLRAAREIDPQLRVL